jgi:hypothetical protein
MKAKAFSSSIPLREPTSPSIKLKPLPIQYDPDTIFGGDSDVDLHDYSDDDGEDADSSNYDPGPCSPRPLSQGQPTIDGLRAWQEERGLCVGQANHYMTTRPSITLLSEIEMDLTPSYPHFTPFNPAILGLTSPRTPSQPPLTTPALPLPLPDYDWDSFGASSCEPAETACCSCEASGDPSVENPANPLYEPHYPLLDPSLDLIEVYPSNSWGDGAPLPDPPLEPPIDSLPSTINISSLDSAESSSNVSWKDSPLLSAKPGQLKKTIMVSRRPWLTPPLPSNIAWRGWVLSKISMILTRPPRHPSPSLDFSLSANERPRRRSAQPHHGESKPPLRNTTPRMEMKTLWTPRSAARRRLERRRNLQPPLLRSRCNYRRSRNRVGPIFLPPCNIDYPHENKKSEYTITDISITDHPEYNKTITVFPPFFNPFYSFPENKTLMYWEVKAG